MSDGSEWDIGDGVVYDEESETETVTVDIAENEVIVGFYSKSDPDNPGWYTEF